MRIQRIPDAQVVLEMEDYIKVRASENCFHNGQFGGFQIGFWFMILL